MKTQLDPFRFTSATLLAISLLSSCQLDEGMEDLERRKLDEATRSILDLGFPEESIQEFEDFYLVEEDIIFPKKLGPGDERSKQAYVTTGLVDHGQVNDITVRIDASIPTTGVDNWWLEVQQAIVDWNNIGNSRLRFTYTIDPTADITVRSDFGALPDNTIAAASWPSGGMAGVEIRVNLDFNSNATIPTGQKRYNMVHELGHTIGFRHTNWSSRGEGSANQLAGTPCTDPISVMNGGTANNSWNGFPPFDRVGGQILYPPDRPAGVFPLFRYYSQSTGDHFYTIYWGELGCGALGYVVEAGIEGYIYQNQAPGTVPIYRYYSGRWGDHFYTLAAGSYSDYTFENIAGYAFSSPAPGRIPIYRYYNANLEDHFYTQFNSSFPGYVSEGIAWYALP